MFQQSIDMDGRIRERARDSGTASVQTSLTYMPTPNSTKNTNFPATTTVQRSRRNPVQLDSIQPPTITIMEHIEVQREIERRAHRLWQLRGRKPGTQLSDWLRAERQVLAEFVKCRSATRSVSGPVSKSAAAPPLMGDVAPPLLPGIFQARPGVSARCSCYCAA
jgi:hypothetical protein